MKAYWIGNSIIAALDPANALLVMARHEPAESWNAGDVQDLTADELAAPVDGSSDTTVAEALQVVIDAPAPSRLSAITHGRGALIRWDYPAA